MPRGDGTGPRGFGPRTGKGLGRCNGYDSPGFTRGYGGGRGYGRGYGWNDRSYYPPVEPYAGVSEKTLIENEIKAMNEQLKALQKRLDAINNSKSEE